ncbi:shq1 [Coprinopsis cinerea okayama7|uniref:Shq1 n=1 Tax=Coprinopsis cinerea (strain Okayama-7 / 130 / ATCC MYA-4618 / FGSC 9003) TaxID=240176 RepID=A8NHG7_COPC7|nr:shq1 [Coprinopsis cinerea okayama7\|eukprot:XP_001833756.1 shq1 [Coprinopsis cinerea okayama7\
MITPRFSCSQTETAVVVSMYCPSIRAADVEINIDETLLTVHVNPYYLRLNFPHSVVEDDASSAQYDPSSGYLTVTLTKEQKGQHFEDLDLLAKLLAPRPSKTTPTIEVLSSETNDELSSKLDGLTLEGKENSVYEQALENDWQIPQQVPEPLPELHTTIEKRYGFLDMHSGYLRHVGHTENEINELGADAETCPKDERRKIRIEREEAKWDPEYYMADFADDENIQELLHWKHPYTIAEGPFEYTESENLEILRLPRKEYLATARQTHELYLTLVTLLYAYAYESRTNQLDPTPESAWTICSLTPAFSALDPPTSSADWKTPANGTHFTKNELITTLVPSYRRALAYPLYRSFALADKCRIDTAQLLLKGKRTVMRCLLDMKRILDHHEVYYVYSKIWVDDFCVWVQAYSSDDVLLELGNCVKDAKVDKDLIGWHLEELEAATLEQLERESDSDDE